MMSPGMPKDISDKYGSRFGRLAVDMRFVTESQLNEALHILSHEEVTADSPRLLPTILFDQGWMTSEQIDQVLNSVCKTARINEADRNDV